MSMITVTRAGLTSEQVSAALREGLGPRYNVLPRKRMTRLSVGNPPPDRDDTILVGTGDNRIYRAEVLIIHHEQQTSFQVRAGGIIGLWLINTYGIARKTRKILAELGRAA